MVLWSKVLGPWTWPCDIAPSEPFAGTSAPSKKDERLEPSVEEE